MSAPIRGIKFSSADPAALARFYNVTLGWNVAWEDLMVTPKGDPRHLGQYGVVDTGYDADVFVSLQPEKYVEYFPGEVPVHRGVSFAVRVDDMDSTIAAVIAGGGKLLAGPIWISVRGGTQALVTDPDGNELNLWKPSEEWEQDAWAKRIGSPTR